MKNIITELWYGNLDPISMVNSQEMNHLETLRERNLEKLRPELGEGAAAMLEKYTDCMDEYAIAAEKHAFSLGFCLGTRLTAEALIGSERLL